MPGQGTCSPLACLCCRDKSCPKNHIEHFTLEEVEPDGTTTHVKCAKVWFKHHKNARRDGMVCLLTTPELVPVLDMVEKAHAHLVEPEAGSRRCPALFLNSFMMPHQSDASFSQYCTKALSHPGQHVTANAMRHAFSTNWRDFFDHTKGIQVVTKELEEGAAHLMGNRPPSWDATYDNHHKTRAMAKAVKLYPQFSEWVREQAKLKRKVVPRNPLDS